MAEVNLDELVRELSRDDLGRVEQMRAMGKAVAAIDSLRAELDKSRETASRLNRRCQSAESGLAHVLEGPGDRTLGRALANSAARMRAHEVDSLRARVDELERERDEARGYADTLARSLVSPDTRSKADAIDRLEKWLRDGRDESRMSVSFLSIDGFGAAHFRVEHTDEIIAHGDTLAAAITAALDEATRPPSGAAERDPSSPRG